jgi:hypothetical protein
VNLFRAMLRREQRAFKRPVTCPFWRWAVSAGMMAATGSLIDTAPVAAVMGLTLAYVLVDWKWIRASWRGVAPAGPPQEEKT